MFIHEPFSLKLKMIALKEKFQITADMENNTKEEWRYSVLNFIWPQFKSATYPGNWKGNWTVWSVVVWQMFCPLLSKEYLKLFILHQLPEARSTFSVFVLCCKTGKGRHDDPLSAKKAKPTKQKPTKEKPTKLLNILLASSWKNKPTNSDRETPELSSECLYKHCLTYNIECSKCHKRSYYTYVRRKRLVSCR